MEANDSFLPKLITRDAFTAVGLAITTDNTREMNPETAQIPGLWQRFFEKNMAIPNKKPDAVPLGIYTDYENDSTGRYSLIAGMATTPGGEIPTGMRAVIIPRGKYLVFPAHGPLPAALIETWKTVWNYFSHNRRYVRAYTTDFEEYLGSEYVAIHIAVQET